MFVASAVYGTARTASALALNVLERDHRARISLIPVAIGIAIFEVPPLRHRRRHQQDDRLRVAGRIHHGRLRRHRRRDRPLIGQGRAEPRALDPCDSGGGGGVPAGPCARSALREPARLRQAGHALRGALGVLGAHGRHLRDRGSSSTDGRMLAEGTGAAGATCGCEAADIPTTTSPAEAAARRSGDAVRLLKTRWPHHGELLGALVDRQEPGESLTPAEHKLSTISPPRRDSCSATSRLIEELRGLPPTARDRPGRGAPQARAQHPRRRPAAARRARGEADSRTADGETTTSARRCSRQVQTESTEALEDLRDLARGIYPPLLADKGLAAALEAQARKSRSRSRSTPTGSAATPRRWRPPSTSAAWRRCRTSRSTRRRRERRSLVSNGDPQLRGER